MNWINVKDRLPEVNKIYSFGGYTKVIAAWGDSEDNVGEMEFCVETVRGKEVSRFKWRGKISPWKVTHWQPLPKPPKSELV